MDWMILLWVAVGAVVFGAAASVLVQWTSGRSAVFSIGLAVLITLVLAAGALIILRIAAARLE